MNFKADHPAAQPIGLGNFGMDFAKACQHGAALDQLAAAARMKPSRPFGFYLHASKLHAKCGKRCLGIRTRVKHINGTGAAMPFTWCRPAMAHACCSSTLVFWRIAKEHRANFEHRRIRLAAVLIARCRRQQVRQDGRPHHRQIRADRVHQLQTVCPAIKTRSIICGQEGKGHRFHQAACGKCAPQPEQTRLRW